MHTCVALFPGRFVLEFVDVGFESRRSIPEGAARACALEQMQGGTQKSIPGSALVEQGPIATGPLVGREFVLSTDGGNRFVRVRLHLTPATAYTPTVQGPVAE